jgi:competence protein ComGC
VLINYESIVGAFLLVALLLLYLVIITLCILFIPALAEYQP